MTSSPFGAAGFGFPAFDPSQFERMGRQWMGMIAPAAAPAPADPFGWWKAAAPAASPTFDPTALAGQWMGQMQQLAAQFGSANAQPADIAGAWRSLVGENPFAQAIASGAFMPAAFGIPGGDAPRSPLDLPAFGYTREHQERAQAFAKTAADYQQASQTFNGLVAGAGQAAFARFESLLAARAAEKKPVESARGLFDLWIDAAEDAYADVAFGEKFQKAFGEYVNSQMRLRAAMQDEVERAGAQWGMPGRSEVDAAHRKIAMLERELRRLREVVEAIQTQEPVRREPVKPTVTRPEAERAVTPATPTKPNKPASPANRSKTAKPGQATKSATRPVAKAAARKTGKRS